MKINLKKNELLIILSIGALICFLPFVFTLNLGLSSFENTGQIGDTIGGITTPFLSFFGSILVYLALKSQITANKEITKQNRDSIFFKIHDSYKANINNAYYIDSKQNNVSGQRLLTNLYENLTKYYYSQRASVGQNIFKNNYKVIDEDSLKSLSIKLNGFYLQKEHEKFLHEIDSKEYRQTALNKLKKIENTNDIFKAIGASSFSKGDFYARSSSYTIAFAQIILDEKEFYLAYFNQFIYVLKYIEEQSIKGLKDEVEFYTKFLNNCLLHGEKALLTSAYLGMKFKKDEALLVSKYIDFGSFGNIESGIYPIANKVNLLNDIETVKNMYLQLSE